MTANRSRHRAFTLIELLGALILLAAFAVIATRLFTSTVKLSYNTAKSHDTIAGLESAIANLRSDVSTATAITATNPTAISLTTPENKTITWTIEGDQLLRRFGEEQTTWPTPGRNTTFIANANVVVLKTDDPRSTLFNEIWLTSMPRLAAKLTQ